MSGLDALADFIFDSSRRATLAEIARLPVRHLCRGNLVRRLRGTGPPGGVDAYRRRQLSRWISPAPRACRRAASTFPGLLPRLFVLRHQMRGGAGDPEQLGIAGAVPDDDPGGLHPERPPPLPGLGPPRHRPSAARPDDGLPASGGAGTGDRRGRLGFVEPAVAGRRRDFRPGARQQAGHRRFRGHHVQFRRHRRAARRRTGWTPPPSPPACAPCRWRRPRTLRRSSCGGRN